MNEGTKGRIQWLDGLKGWAAMGVFSHHFLLGFYPAAYFGSEKESLAPFGLDQVLSIHPLGVFVNGNFWVCVFLTISAFLLSNQVMKLPEQDFRGKLSKILLKRYPRLLKPTLITAVFAYFLLKILTFSGLNYIHKTTELSVPGLLLHSLVIQWVTPDPLVLGPFWMLHYLLFCSFLAILLAIPDKEEYQWYPVFLLAMTYPLGMINRYFVSAALGALLSDLFLYRMSKREGQGSAYIVFGILLILAGLYLGGYPSYVEDPPNFYRHFGFYVHRVVEAYEVIHCAGAFFLLAGLWLLPKRRFLEGRLSQYLGRCAFPVYLVHILWIEYFGYWFRDFLKPSLGYGGASFAAFITMLAGILLSAEIYKRLGLT